ncbi:CG18404 [Drosophila busckii]|uniref:CG18404 n=1 Tax=Drosophila busckii TaxID=30019 RepID=A0A0M3QYE8_DROBS|nr:uncharacterized protein LOC108602597 [Drosophila busckii]ALC47553.1 CG18404 [Drosophila busckii]
MQTYQTIAILATLLVAAQAGTVNFGDIMGDVSKVAVAGEKQWHKLAQQFPIELPSGSKQILYVKPEAYNVLSDMANSLGDLANAITSLNVKQQQATYVKPEAYNVIGDVLGGVANGLGDLANAITSLSVQMKAQPNTYSVASDGASIIGEAGGISAKTIAAAANAAAPYVKQINAGLGDLANAITSL